jgi:hypothetical protein
VSRDPNVPPGTLEALLTAWRKHWDTIMTQYPAQRVHAGRFAEQAQTADLGYVQRPSRGTLTALDRGDLVLVWDDNPAAHRPSYTVWHPRNHVATVVARDSIVLVHEERS